MFFLQQVVEYVFFFFKTVIGTIVGKSSAIFTLAFYLKTRKNKKLLSTARNKKKHGRIPVLTKNKLNSIEALISQVLIDMEITRKEFIRILNEEEKMRK